jgi:5-methylcytosine-specific restriction enzyme A
MNDRGPDHEKVVRGSPENHPDWMPDMDELWRSSLEIEIGPDINAIEAEVFAKIKEIRREHDFMVYVDIYVYVAVCSACTYMACQGMDVNMPLPEVFGAIWPRSYANLGMSSSEIKATRWSIKEGWRGVSCRTCGEIMPLQRDINFYVVKEPLSQYFYLDEGKIQFGSAQGQRIEKRKRTRKKKKQKVLQFFGCECAGCHRILQPDEATMDHIIAVAEGGPTQLFNLQPLCCACNQAKGNQPVDIVEITLTFPLRPPPSNTFDMIW